MKIVPTSVGSISGVAELAKSSGSFIRRSGTRQEFRQLRKPKAFVASATATLTANHFRECKSTHQVVTLIHERGVTPVTIRFIPLLAAALLSTPQAFAQTDSETATLKMRFVCDDDSHCPQELSHRAGRTHACDGGDADG
ncbi:MAG: hypothetical protein AAF802_22640 [Planctomycetota bacterium]